MKRLPYFLAPVLLLASARADDQTREAQAALKAKGFYYGEAKGSADAEMDAAIRRFQIRSGIPVTGKLNAATLAALGLAERKPAPPAPEPAPQPPAPVQKPCDAVKAPAPAPGADKQFNPPIPAPQANNKPAEPAKAAKKAAPAISEEEKAVAVLKPSRRKSASEEEFAAVEPPVPVPSPVSTPYTITFRDTPYAAASREVQAGVVRRAQAILAARQFYDGKLDGVAGPATSEAIFLFQAKSELPRTGRLDKDTLAEMELLPRATPGNPLLKPFYNPNRHRDTSVSPDYWLR